MAATKAVRAEQRQLVPAALALFLCSWISVIGAQESRVGQIERARPFLRWDRPGYRNYALVHSRITRTITLPTMTPRKVFVGPLGNELIAGHDLYAWRETRTPGQRYGSSIFKPNLMYNRAWNRRTARGARWYRVWCCT